MIVQSMKFAPNIKVDNVEIGNCYKPSIGCCHDNLVKTRLKVINTIFKEILLNLEKIKSCFARWNIISSKVSP